MSDSKDKQVSTADEIEDMSKFKDKMMVGDYNEVMAKMREISAIERARENKNIENREKPEK